MYMLFNKELKRKLKIGDIIYSNIYYGCHIQYKITHIDWWGVYAILTKYQIAKFREKICVSDEFWYNELLPKYKYHKKIKWQNISYMELTK